MVVELAVRVGEVPLIAAARDDRRLADVDDADVAGGVVRVLYRDGPLAAVGLEAERLHIAAERDYPAFDSGLSYRGEGARVITGLEHLEGCSVAILTDGSPLPQQVVRDACITLPYSAKTVHVGLPYRSLLCPQTPEADLANGSSLGRFRSYGQARMRLLDSVGGKFGPDPQTLYDLPFVPTAYGTAVQPFSGDRSFSPSLGYGSEGSLWLAQDLPLPFTIVALTLDVDISG